MFLVSSTTPAFDSFTSSVNNPQDKQVKFSKDIFKPMEYLMRSSTTMPANSFTATLPKSVRPKESNKRCQPPTVPTKTQLKGIWKYSRLALAPYYTRLVFPMNFSGNMPYNIGLTYRQ